ncbi:MAG: hypothetical protein O7G31_01265, partial [Calditrichaeota bacterium]|nr:hypothetical protein [Calditrichota bacterium]
MKLGFVGWEFKSRGRIIAVAGGRPNRAGIGTTEHDAILDPYMMVKVLLPGGKKDHTPTHLSKRPLGGLQFLMPIQT